MPGSSNFLQFNPTGSNQESDSSYATDTQRLNGIQVDDIFPSPLANKIFFQQSTFIAALAAALAAKGFVVADTNLATLTTILGNLLTTADALPSVLYKSSGEINHTGTTSNDTIYTVNLPVLKTDSVVRVTFTYSVTGQGGPGTNVRLIIGGVIVGTNNWGGIFGFPVSVTYLFSNRGALNLNVTSSIVGLCNTSGQIVSEAGILTSIDTSIAQTLQVKAQNGSNGDVQIFHSILVELL